LDGGTRSTATLTGATIATRSLGLLMLGGAVTFDGGTIAGGNPATEGALGADITGGTAVFAGTALSGGSRFTGIQLGGSGQVTLRANSAGPTRVTTTLPATASDASDGVVIAAGASGASLLIDGGTDISKFDSGLVVNDGSLFIQGAGVTIKENRGNGIELLGRVGGVVVTLSSGTVRDNARTGIVMRSTVPSTIQNLTISGNGGDGFDAQRTQTAAQIGYRLVFAGNSIVSNGGRGIALTGKGTGAGSGTLLGGKVGVRLERNTVTNNAGVGIYVTESVDAPDGDDVTEVSMDTNDVGGNLTAAATAPVEILAGGVFFARSDLTTRIVLGSFLGNRVHGNGRHEIGFDVAQDGGAAWNLSSNASGVDMATGCAATAKPNTITCYDTVMGQDLAIAVASPGIPVNVQGMHFQNANPIAGRDYSLAIPAAQIAVACTPQACP
ncbi:MAG: right-handed parallel beta-helix repeat-containing protein, partial [Deltaproteobacteria bacterium]|nr:right-handed parallel beta-helix repeat-containing protein [Deltaproteobacteria bacterium]